MWRLVESFLAKPEDSDVASAASLLFPLVGGLIAIVAASPFIKRWTCANYKSGHLTIWSLVLPSVAAFLVGSLPGGVIGLIIDQRASYQTRYTIVRCRQVLLLLLSAGFVVWSIHRLIAYADSPTFLVFFPTFVILGLGQTRWRLRFRGS
jgi:hypothetical protein